MKIGIDISQIAHEGTGVAAYTRNLVENLLRLDRKNEYVLFFSSLRKSASWRTNFKFLNKFQIPNSLPRRQAGKFQIKTFRLPPLLLEFLWNRLHLCPIEWFIGQVDVFLSSDWLQPPARAKKVTTIHDLIVFRHPESFEKKGSHNIVANQKRRLKWVKRECDLILCDSEATKKDVREILGIDEERLRVVYPGGRC